MSPGALANVDFLCNKGAVFGETIKDTPYILTIPFEMMLYKCPKNGNPALFLVI